MPAYTVADDESGLRADIYVAKKYPGFSRSSLENLFDKQLIKISSRPIKPSKKLKSGEKLLINDKILFVQPAKTKLPVIYQDQNVIVINKPAGLLTHSKGVLNTEPSVASFIKPLLAGDIADTNRAGIVHRLDRHTSGVIICAKNKASLSYLQKQFSLRKVKKTYVAIVSGLLEPPAAIIDVPIARNPRHPQTFRPDADGKASISEYSLVRSFEKDGKTYSLIEVRPKTGRTHQIRVHMAYVGHPILGDSVYAQVGAEHMYLHSSSLEITIPGGERKIFKAPEPIYFKDFYGR